MYVISELSEIKSIEKTFENFDNIINLYDDALEVIAGAISVEKKRLSGYLDSYTHRIFFKGNRPKIYIADILSKNE